MRDPPKVTEFGAVFAESLLVSARETPTPLHANHINIHDIVVIIPALPFSGYETLTKVASICIICGRVNRTLFLYNVGFFNCKGFPSK